MKALRPFLVGTFLQISLQLSPRLFLVSFREACWHSLRTSAVLFGPVTATHAAYMTSLAYLSLSNFWNEAWEFISFSNLSSPDMYHQSEIPSTAVAITLIITFNFPSSADITVNVQPSLYSHVNVENSYIHSKQLEEANKVNVAIVQAEGKTSIYSCQFYISTVQNARYLSSEDL